MSESLCMRCRKKTANVNGNIVKGRKSSLMYCHCAVCGAKKVVFVSNAVAHAETKKAKQKKIVEQPVVQPETLPSTKQSVEIPKEQPAEIPKAPRVREVQEPTVAPRVRGIDRPRMIRRRKAEASDES